MVPFSPGPLSTKEFFEKVAAEENARPVAPKTLLSAVPEAEFDDDGPGRPAEDRSVGMFNGFVTIEPRLSDPLLTPSKNRA